VRQASLRIAAPLRPEDMVIQTASFASPTKWHLAHTTWFFERFLLAEYVPGYEPHHPRYEYLFNSYYNTVGPQHCRANRGVVSRPDVHEVMAYREAVDRRMLDWLDTLETTGDKGPGADEARHRLIVGLHHEQQHQELMVSDLKYTFATNPLLPVYQEPLTDAPTPAATLGPAAWIDHDGGLSEVGAEPSADRFTYDNESPRHRVYLEPFALADRPVSNGEFRRFLEDGGYDRHELWLSAGWAWRQAERIEHPLYWYRDPAAGEGWMQYTLHGPRPLDEAEPVCHLSYFEADAFARWADARLPTEFEWETAARGIDPPGADDPIPPFHPRPLTKLPETLGRPRGLYTGTWEWTSSSYAAYPGFKPAAGALGEYNGKFMCNQYVLRGGCVATPPGHTRPTYRNFYAASDRWAFTGLRLARTL
jgi:ergothioneine biosynthesis protein EgtB